MKFIRKKNLQEGEELLYAPSLHWMFVVRHMVLSLPFFLLLLALWLGTDSYAGSLIWHVGLEGVLIIKATIKYTFLAALVIMVLVFAWRIFQFLCTEYGVTNRRLIIKKGVIRVVVAEIMTGRIESIHCVQGLLGRICNYGTVRVSGIGGTRQIFHMISHPYILRRKIIDIIEKNKAIAVVRGELPKAKTTAERPESAKNEPIYRYGTFSRVLAGTGK